MRCRRWSGRARRRRCWRARSPRSPSQHKLLQATSAGSTVLVDTSKLAQSERLILEVKKQLDVSERVLAHEARFAQAIKVDAVSESDVMTEAEAYLASSKKK